MATAFGLTSVTGSGVLARRIGWLEVDLGLLFDEDIGAAAHNAQRISQPVPFF